MENDTARDAKPQGGHLTRRLPRLFVKYWWQLILALGLPLVLALAAEAYFGYRAQLEQIKRTQSVQALAFGTAIDASLQRETRYVARLYRIPWPSDRLQHLAEELEVAMSLFPAISQVTVRGADSELLFVSQLEPRRVARETTTPEGKVGDLRSTFTVSRVGPREIPSIIMRIPSDRRPAEHLEMAIDLRTISDLLRQGAQRDGSIVYVVGGNGVVLAHSDLGSALSGADMRSLEHVRVAFTSRPLSETGLAMESIDGDGRDVMATVRRVPETDWLVVIERPLSEALVPVRQEFYRTLLFLGLALLAATLLGAALAHRFTRPVLDLGRDVERIGRGELAHRANIATGDEIQRLATQVNEMAASLQDYTHGLERKVEEKTAKLQEAMRAREIFLAAASHDLRQPLYAISILGDALALRAIPDDAREVLSKQRQAIGILRSLFDNLLDLSRFEAGEVRKSLRDVSLREVLAPTAVEFEVLSTAKGLRWACDLPDVSIRTDPELLRRLVANLLSNAVRYTPSGSVTLSGAVVGPSVLLAVSDSGIGIAKEDQGRIFQEFVQLENPARERERGVGLGLSIVRKINELLEAGLELDSEPGRGTRITFRIPLSEAAAEPAAAEQVPATAADFPGARIWVVEDDPLVRTALGIQLDEWAIDHDFAVDRAEILALKEADGEWPAAVILDDMLGKEEHGLEIAQWLGQHMDADRIVLVTGNVEPSRVQALQASGFRILRKPIASAVLAQALGDALRAARSSPAEARAG